MWGVPKLKQKAFKLKEEYDSSNWFKRTGIKNKLRHVLDEIEYQEGRKQFANIIALPGVKRCSADPMKCECGCWQELRDKQFKI
ncbi:hypothetical protein [Chengkuizengella marina]|uniref:Uncharacterized protein n=1 Tax=Chengkuizengella marina TaxID=2507566 RepID=A0A6N9Q839_9BACL|nr:hypothetical protein [Chengkuizengella marina]NBI31028.1 hypothetical protein [Chengkuizengella marina]